MNLTSIVIILYLVKVKPMNSNYLNFMEVFNEIILYCCTGLVVGMTDYQPERVTEITD
jgi:Gpi18-like mannosyltransferase